MPTWLIGAVRTALQAGWGYLAAWLLGHNITVPSDVPEPLALVVLALVAGAVAGLIQWAERRSGSNVLARLVKAIARILMLGQRVAQYPKPAPPVVAELRAEWARNPVPGRQSGEFR